MSTDDKAKSLYHARVESWKRLMDKGLFDDSFAQRVNSTFQYLTGPDSLFFTLRDFTDKGKFVISYLCISMSLSETNFAIMDIFRRFDRKATGRIHIDDFVLGIIDRISRYTTDDRFVEAVVYEAMPYGSTSLEQLVAYLFSDSSSAKGSAFQLHFGPLAYLVKKTLSQYPFPVDDLQRGEFDRSTHDKSIIVDSSVLVTILKDSVRLAVAELQEQFHLPWSQIKPTIADHASSLAPDSFSIDLPSERSEGAAPAWLAAASKVRGSAAPLWVVRWEGGRIELGASSAGDNRGNARKRHVFSGLGLNNATGRKPGSKAEEDDDDDKSEDGTHASAAKGSHSHSRVSHRRERGLSADSSDDDSDAEVKPGQANAAMATALGLDAAELQAIGGLDESKLFLLQTAFRSIGNFFSLVSNPPEMSPTAAARTLQSKFVALQQKQLQQQVGSRSAAPSDEGLGSSLPLMTTTSSLDTKKELESMRSGATGTREVSEFEAELARNLVLVQDKLLRTTMRLDVMEMVQLSDGNVGGGAEVISGGYWGDGEFKGSAEGDGEEKSSPNATRQAAVGDQDPLSFDVIMKELGALKSCIVERATTDLALGKLLDTECALIPLHGPNRFSLSETLNNVEESSRQLQDIYKRKLSDEERQGAMSFRLAMQEEHIAELNCLKEQHQQERNQLVTCSIELQILRDKVYRVQTDLEAARLFEKKSSELERRVMELEGQLSDAQAKEDKDKGFKGDGDQDEDSLENSKIALHAQLEETVQEKERLRKENNRLSNAVKVLELRIKNSLQDQMTLQQQLHLAEDELTGSKAYLETLRQELDSERMWKDQNIELTRKIHELQRELLRREAEIKDAKLERASARQHRQELSAAESVIESLENRVNELGLEAEKGVVALEQLDNYRLQLRQKTKENRELSLTNKGLESQLKDVKTVKARHTELSEELQECKIKLEKLPILLAEVARLRGSSRAAVKALTEQDKTIADYKARVKVLERDTNRLRADNRSMQDVEQKLKEANAEIAKLMTMVGEVTALRAGVKNAEEEKLALEGQYKKMRKFVRSSVLSSGNQPGSPSVDPVAAAAMAALHMDTSGASSSSTLSKPSAMSPGPPRGLPTVNPAAESVKMAAPVAVASSKADISASEPPSLPSEASAPAPAPAPASVVVVADNDSEPPPPPPPPRAGGLGALLGDIVNRGKLKKTSE